MSCGQNISDSLQVIKRVESPEVGKGCRVSQDNQQLCLLYDNGLGVIINEASNVLQQSILSTIQFLFLFLFSKLSNASCNNDFLIQLFSFLTDFWNVPQLVVEL